MIQLEPYKLKPTRKSIRKITLYILASSPRNARAQAIDMIGWHAGSPFYFRCSRVKDESELPKDVAKQLKKHRREWDKHVADLKSKAANAIYSTVNGITKEEAKAVINEIALRQVPYVGLNISGAINR